MLWALSQCLEVDVAYFFDGLAVKGPETVAPASGRVET